MAWSSIREFLRVPDDLTGKGVRIAVVDGDFPAHPDIACNPHREVLLVRTSDPAPEPRRLESTSGPWRGGEHGLWSAAAAAGSGAQAHGRYTGTAPMADLLLVAAWSPGVPWDSERAIGAALLWLRDHWRAYAVRGVITAIRGRRDSGLLPWQVDPLRRLCEELAAAGLLVIAGSGNNADLTSQVTQAACPSVLSVGGVTVPASAVPADAEPYTCCRGWTFEGKYVPEILAPAQNIVTPYGWAGDLVASAVTEGLPEGYVRNVGTSLSGPVVLGAAACLWQVHPGWTAEQMRSALVGTAQREPRWVGLHAGLVSVTTAVGAEVGISHQAEPPFGRWTRWQGASVSRRVGAVRGSIPDVDAILSWVPDAVPSAALDSIRPLLRHESPWARAAAMCALAETPEVLTVGELTAALRDPHPIARAAALYALGCARCDGHGTSAALAELYDDPHPDISYCALRLGSDLADISHLPRLIRGLPVDVAGRRNANFAARLALVERLAGFSVELAPVDARGPEHADELWRNRTALAGHWGDWLARGGTPCS